MFPPNTNSKKLEAIEWFDTYYNTKAINDIPGAIELLQVPGETVYVPAGWYRVSINLTTTFSVTHNYASPHGGEKRKIWRELVVHEPEFAQRW